MIAPERRAHDRSPSAKKVHLRRGFYPGFSWGELLISADIQSWQFRAGRDDFRLVQAWLPDYGQRGNGRSFQLCEVYEHYLPSQAKPWNYHVVEIVSDTVSGPQFRIRDLYGNVWSNWRKLLPGALPMYVEDRAQPQLALATGVMFKALRQLEADRQRETENLRRQQQRRDQSRRNNNSRPFRRN